MADSDHYDGLGPRALRPLANTDIDVIQVKMTPVEGFVYSRVDGLTSYREIIIVAGLPAESTLTILRDLKNVGLIFNLGETPPLAPRSRMSSSVPPRSPSSVPSNPLSAFPPLLERLDDDFAVDPKLLQGAPALDETTKIRIARVHRLLPRLDAAALLGVERDAGPRAFKKAYFAASKEVHPDRYFGKDIGRFRTMLEELFKRCTDAFNELNEPHRKKK